MGDQLRQRGKLRCMKHYKGYKELNKVKQFVDWGVVIDRTEGLTQKETVMEFIQGFSVLALGAAALFLMLFL